MNDIHKTFQRNDTSQQKKTFLSFWALGVLNNMPYVVMIAGAKSISEGGTALVFVCNVLPSLCIKLTAPYWFDKVSYSKRFKVASCLMSASFLLVAVFGSLESNRTYNDENAKGLNFNVFMQLLGVGLCSAQGGLGEASLLALSAKVENISSENISNDVTREESGLIDEQLCDENLQAQPTNTFECKSSLNIAAFSSGTGLAGVFGFFYIFVTTKLLKLSLPQTLIMSLTFSVAYWFIYDSNLATYTTENAFEQTNMAPIVISHRNTNEMYPLSIEERSEHFLEEPLSESFDEDNILHSITENQGDLPLSTIDRIYFILSLWKYTIPLFVVYATEYAMQSGVWTAIGFPVDNITSRGNFYIASNWVYQIGVFLSRSSGAFYTAPIWLLWTMPVLQTINLIFFYYVAISKFWYNYFLLIPAFYVGLLGGAVYVSGYQRINKDLPLPLREMALSSASVADSFGILLADISGLFIQACIYDHHGVEGAVVTCPLKVKRN